MSEISTWTQAQEQGLTGMGPTRARVEDIIGEREGSWGKQETLLALRVLADEVDTLRDAGVLLAEQVQATGGAPREGDAPLPIDAGEFLRLKTLVMRASGTIRALVEMSGEENVQAVIAAEDLVHVGRVLQVVADRIAEGP